MKAMANVMVATILAGGLVACEGDELDTRTFELRYMPFTEAYELISPYVYTDREGAPGMVSTSRSAVTVRETPDNLAKIARMLEEFDRPRPTVMLHFQVIEADGASPSDPAIADVERELRRLFRFDGYDLAAETRVGGMEGSSIRQIARGDDGESFMLESHIEDVRSGGDTPTITLSITLSTREMTGALETRVTVPTGHAVVLGTAETEQSGALILVVRAEVAGQGTGGDAAESDATTADTATAGL